MPKQQQRIPKKKKGWPVTAGEVTDWLRGERASRGRSLKEWSDALGFDLTTYHRVENKRRAITTAECERIAEFLEVPFRTAVERLRANGTNIDDNAARIGHPGKQRLAEKELAVAS